MKNWKRFIKQVDFEEEKRLIHDIKLEKQAIKKLESVLRYDIGASRIEPKQEKVSYGALYRCCLCLGSIMTLISNGYIGSAYALFRQVYEFLVWSKLSIDLEETHQLIKLHDDFYNSESDRKKDNLYNYFPKIRYEILNDDTIYEEEIKQMGRDVFKAYSSAIHGNADAQQYPLQSDEFYSLVDGCIKEAATWISCLAVVMNSYIFKCLKFSNVASNETVISGILNSNEIKQLIMGDQLSQIVHRQIKCMQNIASGLEHTIMFKTFLNTKWTLKH